MSSDNYSVEAGRLEGGWVYAASASSENVAASPTDTASTNDNAGSLVGDVNANLAVDNTNSSTPTNDGQTVVVPVNLSDENLNGAFSAPDNSATATTGTAIRAFLNSQWFAYSIIGLAAAAVILVIIVMVKYNRRRG